MGPYNTRDTDVARRLTAVLAADVAGYSRLMARDELGALGSLKSLRSTIIEPLVARHRGTIVGTAGDSLLVSFASAIDAVVCALAWQQACDEAAESQSPDRRMLFRIGIHLGDVIPDSGTIYGDGVNIASRLEKLAQPGGLVVSRAIREQVETRLNLGFSDLGRPELKNMARPVEAFAVVPGQATQTKATDPVRMGSSDPKLSIAILPFANMSGDEEQEYFSDGITEDIITEISRFRELRVIARNSSFAFRGQNIEITEIARRLGVQFVVEGSVRKVGNRLRITAQLVEAGSDRHIWADRYDRDVDDVFSIQDEIARTVAAMTAGHVRTAGAERTRARPTESLSAYDLFLRARSMISHYAKLKEVEALLARAIELDPDYAMAHAMMANILNVQSFYDNDVELRERAAECARRAIKLDPNEAWGHGTLGFCLLYLRRVPEAAIHFERATKLNPNDVFIAMHYALWHCFAGHVEEAIVRIQKVLDRDPFAHDWFWDVYSLTLVVAGKYEEALAAFERMMTPAPWTFAYAAIAQVNLGNLDGARKLAVQFREAASNISIEEYFRIDPYVDPAVPERLTADLKKALSG
jgi:adenylate cyclase